MPATVRPSSFYYRDGKAVIVTEEQEIEIYDKDISRLLFMLTQVMDAADRKILEMLLEHSK